MTLVSMTIPDSPAALPVWLELRLVSTDFARFVAELTAANPDRDRARRPARDLMGEWYTRALTGGLRGIPTAVLRQLLRNPKALLEFQEAVLGEGGPYWDEVTSRAEALTGAFDRGRATLQAMAEPTPQVVVLPRTGPSSMRTTAPPPTDPIPNLASLLGNRPPGAARPPRRYRALAAFSSLLAIGLAVAVGVLAFRDTPPAATTVVAVNWGWAKPGGIPQGSPKPAEYLTALADTASEWFDRRPDDAPGLARRLNEFRTGCTQLIFAAHTPLPQTDREWLQGRCREWGKRFDEHLTTLEAGADPLKVRDEADATIRKLQAALRDRAGPG